MVQISANQTFSSGLTLKIACYGAAAALCGVTMAANFTFGVTLGVTTIEKIIYAISSVAADIVKCTAVVVVIRLWLKRRRVMAGVGAVLGVICLLWSMASAAGFALATREHTAAMHAAASNVVQGWVTTIRRAGEQLKLIGQSRPEAVIRAELTGQMIPSAVWKRTRQCVELTLPESQQACAPVLKLRQELAAAQSAQALEERIADARQELATQPVVGQSADPQVTGLASVLGTQESTLRRGLALLLAVLVEVGSAFGFAIAHAATANPPSPPLARATPRTSSVASTAPRSSTSSTVVKFPEQAARRKSGRRPTTAPDATLLRWADQCVRRDAGGCIGARATYQSYCRWAQEMGVVAVSETMFGRFLTGRVTVMGGSKTQRRTGAVYLGVRVVQAPAPQSARIAA